MYRCDYCDGIVEAKCISIQFQRYRQTNHNKPVTIVKTIHFTPERSSLPVIWAAQEDYRLLSVVQMAPIFQALSLLSWYLMMVSSSSLQGPSIKKWDLYVLTQLYFTSRVVYSLLWKHLMCWGINASLWWEENKYQQNNGDQIFKNTFRSNNTHNGKSCTFHVGNTYSDVRHQNITRKNVDWSETGSLRLTD